MLERLVLSLFLLLLALALLKGARWFVSRQRQQRLRSLSEAERLPGAGILYFWTERCVQCRTLQEPALRRLPELLGEPVPVTKVNALEAPDIARRYGVLTVPTTAVFGADGRLVAINTGYAPAEQLAAQLRSSATPALR